MQAQDLLAGVPRDGPSLGPDSSAARASRGQGPRAACAKVRRDGPGAIRQTHFGKIPSGPDCVHGYEGFGLPRRANGRTLIDPGHKVREHLSAIKQPVNQDFAIRLPPRGPQKYPDELPWLDYAPEVGSASFLEDISFGQRMIPSHRHRMSARTLSGLKSRAITSIPAWLSPSALAL